MEVRCSLCGWSLVIPEHLAAPPLGRALVAPVNPELILREHYERDHPVVLRRLTPFLTRP